MAAVIRATLSLPNPTEDDLERILEMLAVSNIEMSHKIKEFVDRICDGTKINEKNRQRLLGWYLCELPENPSIDQLQAWHDIFKYLDDQNIVNAMNINLKHLFGLHIGTEEYYKKAFEIMGQIDRAWAEGLSPESIYAKEIVRKILHYDASALRVSEEDIIHDHLAISEYGGLGKKLRDLCAVIRGEALPDRSSQRPQEFWDWFHEVVIAIQSENLKI